MKRAATDSGRGAGKVTKGSLVRQDPKDTRQSGLHWRGGWVYFPSPENPYKIIFAEIQEMPYDSLPSNQP